MIEGNFPCFTKKVKKKYVFLTKYKKKLNLVNVIIVISITQEAHH